MNLVVKVGIIAVLLGLGVVSPLVVPAAAESANASLGAAQEARFESSSGRKTAAQKITRSSFPVSPGIQGRVEFWRLLFTKYGKNHAVFHHRKFPEILYSVLDFSEYARRYSGKQLVKMKDGALAEELERIQTSLKRLGKGEAAQTPFEERLVRVFRATGLRIPQAFADAAQVELIRSQTGVRERFSEGIARSSRYLHAMEQILAAQGLPTELARLPLIESSFDYTAYSSVGAAGIWQFMRSTGKKYLRITTSVDERRDPILATRAAGHYLSHAYNRLQTWPLAVTSYNHGVAGVARAVKSTGTTDLGIIVKNYDGESFGFASSNFYPEFVAAVEIEKNWRVYFPNLEREKPWYFDEIELKTSVTLPELVKRSGVESSEIERLNRGFLDPVLAGRAAIPAGSMVKVPYGQGAKVIKAFGHGAVLSLAEGDEKFALRVGAGIPENHVSEKLQKSSGKGKKLAVASSSAGKTGTRYLVKQGDTLETVARKFRVTPTSLATENGLARGVTLRPGMVVQVPASQIEKPATNKKAPRPTKPKAPRPTKPKAKSGKSGKFGKSEVKSAPAKTKPTAPRPTKPTG